MKATSAIAKGKICLNCDQGVSVYRKYCGSLECQKIRQTKNRKTYLEKHGRAKLASSIREWRHKTGRTMSRGESIAEEIVFTKLVKVFGNEILRRTRSLIRNPETNTALELDFYIPKLRLAFEVDGATHRTECYGKERLIYQQKNDLIKDKECRRLGIKLVRIPFGRDIKSFGEFAILPLKDLESILLW